MATFLSVLRLSTKPTHWPSGDTKGPRGAPLYTLTGSSASSDRTKRSVPLLPTYTMREPSGVIARSRPAPLSAGAVAGVVATVNWTTRGGVGRVVYQTAA